MLSSDEVDKDEFFDSASHLSSDESGVSEEELESRYLDYDIWMTEPCSIKERRGRFLNRMGLVECAPKHELEKEKSTEKITVERILDSNGAVSNSSASYLNETGLTLADHLVQNQDDRSGLAFDDEYCMLSHPAKECKQRETDCNVKGCESPLFRKSKWRALWKRLGSIKQRGGTFDKEASKQNLDTQMVNIIKVKTKNKGRNEFSALYFGQEIQAHKGLIWSLKFSPDGQFLATGGKDGIVRIWRVASSPASSKYFPAECNCGGKLTAISPHFNKESVHIPVLVPDKIFHIEELPIQEFRGHTGDVLDLAWYSSNHILSASMDKTVRLWQAGSDQCVHIFHHSDCVTSVQFNPADDKYFITGSIDGNVRVWGHSSGRVVDWVHVGDVITAVCYNPDGKGFIVGSVAGTCLFYESSDNSIQLKARINIQDKKKMPSNKITGIQFPQDDPRKVMIFSEDSKIRMFDIMDVYRKYQGLSNSGSQISASYTSNGKHIISVGQNSRVYIWNYDNASTLSSKQIKSLQSCEYFFSDGLSAAVSWSGNGAGRKELLSALQGNLQIQDQPEAASKVKDLEHFSLNGWLLIHGTYKGSSTWPEEKLLSWEEPLEENQPSWLCQKRILQENFSVHNHSSVSEAWGLVIVTAGHDGKIRTFQNFGLPVRL